MNRAARGLLGNVAVFQFVWWTAVAGAAHGLPWAGPLAALAGCAWHLATTPASARGGEGLLIVYALAFGTAADAMLMACRLIAYAPGTGLGPEWLAPAWMAALWASFATTLNRSLGWLRARPLLAAACGALGGPLAYAGGVALGAAGWPRGAFAGLLASALLWAVALPLLSGLAALTYVATAPAAPAGSASAGKAA